MPVRVRAEAQHRRRGVQRDRLADHRLAAVPDAHRKGDRRAQRTALRDLPCKDVQDGIRNRALAGAAGACVQAYRGRLQDRLRGQRDRLLAVVQLDVPGVPEERNVLVDGEAVRRLAGRQQAAWPGVRKRARVRRRAPGRMRDLGHAAGSEGEKERKKTHPSGHRKSKNSTSSPRALTVALVQRLRSRRPPSTASTAAGELRLCGHERHVQSALCFNAG